MTKPRKIVLIGTEHKYQKRDDMCRGVDAQAFQSFLLRECRRHGIKTVAEELNTQALKETKARWESLKKTVEESNKNEPYNEELEEERKEALKAIEEALEWHKKGTSIPQRVAEELTLQHRFCDPNREERGRLGIFQENDLKIQSFPDPPMPEDEIQRQVLEGHRRRERYWLEQLQQEVSESEYPVLFICGADHVDAFSKLLEENDFNVICICDDWESSIPTDPHYPMKKTSILGPFSCVFRGIT